MKAHKCLARGYLSMHGMLARRVALSQATYRPLSRLDGQHNVVITSAFITASPWMVMEELLGAKRQAATSLNDDGFSRSVQVRDNHCAPLAFTSCRLLKSAAESKMTSGCRSPQSSLQGQGTPYCPGDSCSIQQFKFLPIARQNRRHDNF